MANAGLRFEDRLDGASNFCPWRERISLVLKENGLLEIAEGKVAAPSNSQQERCQGHEDNCGWSQRPHYSSSIWQEDVKFYMQQREPFSWRMAKTLDEI
jgi:hypothetical protein